MHEMASDLHRQNQERQDALVQQHKDEMQTKINQKRRQLHELGNNADSQKKRKILEGQFRQMIGEYGQAQEAIEHSRRLSTAAARRRAGLEERTHWRQSQVGKLALEAGAATWQGGKEVQEDRHIVDLELVTPEGHTIPGYCVLDGHSGSRCVEQLLERLPANLQSSLSAKKVFTEESLKQVVVEACAQTDEEFLAGARQRGYLDGTTMILALFFFDPARATGTHRLLIANVGDSRAVLCRAFDPTGGAEQLNALRLSDDHKPNRQDEESRIRKRGGIVDLHGAWRVFLPSAITFAGRLIPRSGLAVSRAFGDVIFKEPESYGCHTVAPGGLVLATPELSIFDIDPATDRFLILACDGIWDVLRDEDTVSICATQAGPELAAHTLVRHAFTAGSGDNLTALVVSWRTVESAP